MADDFRFISDPSFFESRSRGMDFKTVDVSEKAVSAVIVREGEQYKAPAVKKASVDDLLSRLKPVERKAVPRVLSQSLPAGTFVARGTPVDLVLVRSADVTMGILEDVHVGLADRTVEELLPVFENPLVKSAMKKGDSSKITDTEKQAVEEALAGFQIDIDESDGQKTFDKAFKSLQGARVFL